MADSSPTPTVSASGDEFGRDAHRMRMASWLALSTWIPYLFLTLLVLVHVEALSALDESVERGVHVWVLGSEPVLDVALAATWLGGSTVRFALTGAAVFALLVLRHPRAASPPPHQPPRPNSSTTSCKTRRPPQSDHRFTTTRTNAERQHPSIRNDRRAMAF
jgi:hypothetical protein